jgi:hypothetical protein
MLIREELEQAKEILSEFDIDCWITFARESGINGDPSLVFLASADVSRRSSGTRPFSDQSSVIRPGSDRDY